MGTKPEQYGSYLLTMATQDCSKCDSRMVGNFGLENLRYLILATGAFRPRPWNPITRTRSRGRGSTRAEECQQRFRFGAGAGAELDNLSVPSVRGSDAIPSLPHTSRVPVSKGIRF